MQIVQFREQNTHEMVLVLIKAWEDVCKLLLLNPYDALLKDLFLCLSKRGEGRGNEREIGGRGGKMRERFPPTDSLPRMSVIATAELTEESNPRYIQVSHMGNCGSCTQTTVYHLAKHIRKGGGPNQSSYNSNWHYNAGCQCCKPLEPHGRQSASPMQGNILSSGVAFMKLLHWQDI